MGTCASKPERTPSGKKASSKPSLSQRDPDSPLEFVLAHWNQLPGHATLSKRKLEDLCQASWPKVTTAVRPELRWPPEGSFNVDRLKTLKKHLREEKPRQLQYLSLFEAAERTVPDCSGRGNPRHLAVLKSKARRPRSQRNLPPPPPYEEPADDSDSFDQSLLPFYYPTATSEDISSEGEIDDEVSGSEGQGRTARASTLAQREKTKKELKTKSKPTSVNDGAGPSSQGDAQMPLRGLPIPPSAPDGPPRMVYAHRPFATTDLVTWSNLMPSLRDDPDRCHRQVSAIFSSYNPTWADVQVLLNSLFNEAEKADILAKAGEALNLPDFQPNRPGGVAPLTATVLRNDPSWNYNNPDHTWCLEVFTRAILEGIRAAGKRVVNWTKVQAVQQGQNEHPSDYFSRLTTAIKTWGGINPESPEHEIIVKGFFKDQATPDIRKALNLQIGYDGKPIGEILSIAKTIFNSREEKTKREGSAEEERVLALNMEPRGFRGRGMVRGRGRGGAPPVIPRPWGPNTGGCYNCGEEGHIKKFCPYLSGPSYYPPQAPYGNPPTGTFPPQPASGPMSPGQRYPPNSGTRQIAQVTNPRPLSGYQTQAPQYGNSFQPNPASSAPSVLPGGQNY
nr:uncharacterized protein LOC118081952 [Zootoca vivipara]